MKYIFLLITLNINCLSGRSQKLVKIDFDERRYTINYPAIVEHLTPDTRIRYFVPENMQYSKGEACKAFFTRGGGVYPFKARFVNFLAEEESKYEIYLSTTGLSDLTSRGNRGVWLGNQFGEVRDYTASFPFKITIKQRNENGNHRELVTIKEIEVFSSTFQHQLVLDQSKLTGYQPTDKPIPFANAALVEQASRNAQVLINMELQLADMAYRRAEEVLRHLFTNYEETDMFLSWGFVKTKKREYEFGDLDTALINYHEATLAMEAKNQIKADSLFIVAEKMYSSALSSSSERIDKNVRDILYFNLAVIFFWQKRYDESRHYLFDLYQPYQPHEVTNYNRGLFAYRLNIEKTRYELKSSRVVLN